MNKFILLLISINLFACTNKSQSKKEVLQNKPITIAISKAEGHESYLNYIEWIEGLDSNVNAISLYSLSIDSAKNVLDKCDGLIISGGPDVFPGRYNKAFDTIRCGSIDFRRDSLEISLINKALENNKPILGICRGLQILNVSLGGSLIVDIPSDFDTIIKHRCPNPENCFHKVNIIDNSFIFDIMDTNQAKVNSNHHQAIDKLADDLIAVAFSNDSLIEAVEWKNKDGKPFLIGVQWHPERMENDNPASFKIGTKFIKACKLYSEN